MDDIASNVGDVAAATEIDFSLLLAQMPRS